jgi:hypothetical protein
VVVVALISVGGSIAGIMVMGVFVPLNAVESTTVEDV